jgi:hypothetical protein
LFYDGVAVISPHKLAGILSLMLYEGPSNSSMFSVALFRAVKRAEGLTDSASSVCEIELGAHSIHI